MNSFLTKVMDLATSGEGTVSELTRVGVPAALWRKPRMGELALSDCNVLINTFEDDYFGHSGLLVPAKVSGLEFDHAASLVATHGLRAYDAVQLACALKMVAIDGECDTLAAFDKELRQAAAREGFMLLPSLK